MKAPGGEGAVTWPSPDRGPHHRDKQVLFQAAPLPVAQCWAGTPPAPPPCGGQPCTCCIWGHLALSSHGPAPRKAHVHPHRLASPAEPAPSLSSTFARHSCWFPSHRSLLPHLTQCLPRLVFWSGHVSDPEPESSVGWRCVCRHVPVCKCMGVHVHIWVPGNVCACECDRQRPGGAGQRQ